MNIGYTVLPAAPAPTDVAELTSDNFVTQRRLVMQHATVPLLESENFRPSQGDQLVVADPGTGQDELCQVESWELPYRSGSERCVRIAFPAVLSAASRDQRFEVKRTQGQTPPQFVLRPNVDAGLRNMTGRLILGPEATHYAEFLPRVGEVLFDGPRSRLVRYFARIYRQGQVETQLYANVLLELFSDMDYAAFWGMWGCDDPRINANHHDFLQHANTADRRAVWRLRVAQGLAEWVPLHSEMCRRRVEYTNGSWDWTHEEWRPIDRGNGRHLMDKIGWGQGAFARAVILFPNGGSLGDALRDESMSAWRQGVWPYCQAMNWKEKEEAWGPFGKVQRAAKRHEHWGRRTYDSVRQDLRNESDAFAQRQPPSGQWTAHSNGYPGPLQALWNTNTGNTGNSQVFGVKCTLLAYNVPAMARWMERGIYAMPSWGFHFYDADGTPFDVARHPEVLLWSGTPHVSSPDKMGKSQSNLFNPSLSIRDDWSAASYVGPDDQHSECTISYAVALAYGDRGVKYLAERFAHAVAAMFPRIPSRRGATGAARAFGRASHNLAWSNFVTPSPALEAYSVEMTSYTYLVAQGGYNSNRLIRPPTTVNEAGGGASALRRFPHIRPWEEGEGMEGAVGMARFFEQTGHTAEADVWKQRSRELMRLVLRYGTARRCDEDGNILYEVAPWRGGSGPVVATALAWMENGLRDLTRQELEDQGNSGDPTGGHSIFEASNNFWASPVFCLFRFAEDMGVDVDNERDLMRYIDTVRLRWPGRANNSRLYDSWEVDVLRMGAGALDPVTLGQVTQLGSVQFTPRGLAPSLLNVGHFWVARTTPGSNILERIDPASGATQAVADPAVSPTDLRGAVTIYSPVGGIPLLAWADIGDSSQSRTSLRALVGTEAGLGADVVPISFTFEDNQPRDGVSLAFDSKARRWMLLCADGTMWSAPEGGGTLVRYRRILFDVQPECFSISSDGELALVTGESRITCYRHLGWGWGAPVESLAAASDGAAFSAHAQVTSALRLVWTNQFWREAEI